jgi:exopolysaccharide biosynthesis polyprenyl glycosylphosphotransferase
VRYQRKPQVRVLGGFQEIEGVIQRQSIDMVILTDVNCVKGDVVGLANTCEREMVQFKVIPSYFQILVSGLHLETVSGIPVLGVSRLPLDLFTNVLLKRAVDIIGASIGLVISVPLVAIFGTIVWFESPGRIFYRQRRLGRNGVEFDIYKIRSMRLNAEPEGSVGWTTKNDPRRLQIGAFIRKWNIDEVPQFWNVLKGEMSLVGPRPERPELIRNFKHEIPHYNARHNAKPGITGWAQVKGLRGDTDLTERINCDLWYLENWNLLLDFQIMFMTFFRNQNAC